MLIYVCHTDVLGRVGAGWVRWNLVSWQEWKTFKAEEEEASLCVMLVEYDMWYGNRSGQSKPKSRSVPPALTPAKQLTAVIIKIITITAGSSQVSALGLWDLLYAF